MTILMIERQSNQRQGREESRHPLFPHLSFSYPIDQLDAEEKLNDDLEDGEAGALPFLQFELIFVSL